MAFDITRNALEASRAQSKTINIVLKIDGIDTLFGSIPIKKFVRIGDPDIVIDDPELNPNAFYIGGFTLIQGQEPVISYDGGTTTKIQQQLQIDKGRSSGVSNFTVRLVDKNQKITELVSPDQSVSPAFDVLGRRARIYLGFDDTAWPEDYIIIFRGVVTRISPGAGHVDIAINGPENNQRSAKYIQASTELLASINNSQTTINVASTADFLQKINDPATGTPTPNFRTYIRIEDEIIEYQTKTATQFQGCTRGQLGTVAVSHNADSEVLSQYRLTGHPLIISLQMMMSGWQGPFAQDISIFQFRAENNQIISNEIDWLREYNIQIGDRISVTGAINGANNFTNREVTSIAIDDENITTITVSGASLVDEDESTAVFSLRSKFDVFPDGFRMAGDEVDVAQHDFIRGTFIPAYNYDIWLKEGIEDGREFIEEKIYSPIACFGIPRKAQASVGYHIGPIPGQSIKTLDATNVKNPKSLKINRSTERYFFNEIVYRFDEDRLEDRFLGGTVFVSQDSKNQIVNRASTLIVDAVGLRSAESALNIAQLSARRRLDRYQFGSEYIDVQTQFGVGFNMEIGDIVVFNGEALQISDIQQGNRSFATRLMEVQQKTLDLKTGDIRLSLVDTNFNGQSRYCLISPSSIIQGGISTSRFIIRSSFGSRFGINEFQKYESFTRPWVRIKNPTGTFSEVRQVANFSGNIVQLLEPLTQVPQAGWIFEFADYSDVEREINLVFGFISDNAGVDFPDDEPTYVLL